MAKKSYVKDHNGRRTHRDTTRTRSDGNVETTRSKLHGAGFASIVGRDVHNPKTGETKHYKK